MGRIIRLDAAGYSGVLRALSGIHVELDEGKTTSWVTVTRTGTFSDPRYGKFEITRQMLLSMVDNFDKRTFGQDVFIDIAHNPSGGAAGKILKLSVDSDRLRAQVEWTPQGLQAIREKGYRYLSAEYHENWQDNEAGAKHGPVLLGAGLVIRPCIKRLDPIQLSEASGSVPTFIHPTLLSELTLEIKMKFAELIKQLKEKLTSFKLAEAVVTSIADLAAKALEGFTDEAQAKLLIASFEDSGKKLAEQIGDKSAVIQLSMPTSGLTAEDVKRLMQEETQRLHDARVKLEQGRDANVKILSDAINGVKDFDEDLRKRLTAEVSDLITPEMTADQVKRLADNQIKHGNELQAAKKLAGMGYAPQGSVFISVDSSNEVKKLQEIADQRLGIARMSDAARFAATNGALSEKNKELAEMVLAQFDREHGAQLHREHKMLAGGDSLVSDVAVPATFERTVIREALYSLVGLQFVDVGTAVFSGSTQIPYSYRDTAAAGRDSTRVYEGGAIARAAMKQTSETAYPIPQKLAFEVSDELRYLTANGQLINWDAVTENARNAIRVIGEDTERLIFNEVLNASDQYAVTAVTNEATATADGTKSIFVLNNFPVVRPKKVYDLQGSQVGSTLYPVVVKSNNVTITEYDGTGTQQAGLYYSIDYNLGEVSFVDQAGAASPPTNAHAVVCSYSYTTNVYKFDTDQGSVATDLFWDTFLYRYGLRKSVIEDQRYHACNFGLMSGTVMTTIEQAQAFVESGARNGTNLDSVGNLGQVKGVANYKSFAPGLAMGDQRIIIGERNLPRYRMAKAWTMGQLQDQKDANGRFTGKKEAYGDQFVFLHTPTQLKAGLTSIVLWSTTARVDR
ncbi:MAG: hypothetical protein HY847_01325 [Betaproteobacteria bacterium]|nr:hypothetical protein [Betaproteobacteria bacterium]